MKAVPVVSHQQQVPSTSGPSETAPDTPEKNSQKAPISATPDVTKYLHESKAAEYRKLKEEIQRRVGRGDVQSAGSAKGQSTAQTQIATQDDREVIVTSEEDKSKADNQGPSEANLTQLRQQITSHRYGRVIDE